MVLELRFFFNELKDEKNLKIDFFFGFSNFYIAVNIKKILKEILLIQAHLKATR